MSDDTERRIDTARELGRINQHLQTLTERIEALSAIAAHFKELEAQMKGAIWITRIVAGSAAAFFAFVWWGFGQLKDLIR